jgi:hypothetical protein
MKIVNIAKTSQKWYDTSDISLMPSFTALGLAGKRGVARPN